MEGADTEGASNPPLKVMGGERHEIPKEVLEKYQEIIGLNRDTGEMDERESGGCDHKELVSQLMEMPRDVVLSVLENYEHAVDFTDVNAEGDGRSMLLEKWRDTEFPSPVAERVFGEGLRFFKQLCDIRLEHDDTQSHNTSVEETSLVSEWTDVNSCSLPVCAILKPLSSSKPPIPMYYTHLTLGSGSEHRNPLMYGSCQFISQLHAQIYYNQRTGGYELLNLSENGTWVDDVFYCLNSSLSLILLHSKLNKRSSVSCGCYIVSQEKKDKMEMGWNKTSAKLHHGSIIQLGCIRFLFAEIHTTDSHT